MVRIREKYTNAKVKLQSKHGNIVVRSIVCYSRFINGYLRSTHGARWILAIINIAYFPRARVYIRVCLSSSKSRFTGDFPHFFWRGILHSAWPCDHLYQTMLKLKLPRYGTIPTIPNCIPPFAHRALLLVNGYREYLLRQLLNYTWLGNLQQVVSTCRINKIQKRLLVVRT